MAAGPAFRLLAITPPRGAVPGEILETWLQDGIHPGDIAVLLREPGASVADLLDPEGRLAGLAHACRDRGVTVLIGCAASDLEAAASTVAAGRIAGVQLRGDPSPDTLRRARDLLGSALLGRSVHGEPDGGDETVDYSCLAPVFAPRTDPEGKPAVGLEALQRWSRVPGARIFALGGVGPTNAADCLARGAHGLAGISTFFGEPDRVAEDVRKLATALADRREARRVPPPRSG